MRTRDDIEAYLQRSTHPHREVDESTWLVGDPSGVRETIVVRIEKDLCVFRLKVLDGAAISDGKRVGLYERLLEINASEMVHAAYGLA